MNVGCSPFSYLGFGVGGIAHKTDNCIGRVASEVLEESSLITVQYRALQAEDQMHGRTPIPRETPVITYEDMLLTLVLSRLVLQIA